MAAKKNTEPSRYTSSLHLIAAIALITAAVAGIVWLVTNSQIGGWDVRNNLWAPSHLLLNGQSPYDLSSLYELGAAVWLPMAIGAFFPLGALPHEQAAMVWLLTSLAAVVGIVWLVADRQRPLPLLFGLALLMVYLYPRTIAHLLLGQFSLLAVLLYLLSRHLLLRQYIWLSALLVALALTKPQLGIFALSGLLIAAYRLDATRGTLRFAAAIVTWIGLLTLPLFLLYPAWIPDFIQALRENQSWLQPSLFSLLPIWLGWPGRLMWALLFVLLLSLNGWLWWKWPCLETLCWSLALTPLASPYIWSWDFVLLLPLLVWGIFHFRSLTARGTLIVGYLINWGLMFWTILGSDGSDHHFWWASWFIVSIALIAQLIERLDTATAHAANLDNKQWLETGTSN
jgi:hypothetical protein